MYCNQCGETIPQGSRFCNHCGATLAAAREVAISAEPDLEETVFVLRPTLIFVAGWYLLSALLVLAATAVVGLFSAQIGKSFAFVMIAAAAVVLFAIPVVKHIQRMREVYTLTNHKLEMRFGLIAKTVQNIPLHNVHNVTVTSSVWERLLGLGDIVIDSASESGKITLSNIHNPWRYADQILAELRRRK
jgi:uncharacterized membrane protein YdbT with pleckstrin-like domain